MPAWADLGERQGRMILSQRTSLEIQWLICYASKERSMGSIPGWGTKIQHHTAQPKNKYVRILRLKKLSHICLVPALCQAVD